MILGRLLGWLLITTALLLGSGQAVMAFGFGDAPGFAAGDIWTLLSGQNAVPASALAQLLLSVPAWTIIGSMGLTLLRLCRQRRRYYFRAA